jgi:hypothetical protein
VQRYVPVRKLNLKSRYSMSLESGWMYASRAGELGAVNTVAVSSVD